MMSAFFPAARLPTALSIIIAGGARGGHGQSDWTGIFQVQFPAAVQLIQQVQIRPAGAAIRTDGHVDAVLHICARGWRG